MFEHLDKQHRMLKPQYKDHLMGIYFKRNKHGWPLSHPKNNQICIHNVM